MSGIEVNSGTTTRDRGQVAVGDRGPGNPNGSVSRREKLPVAAFGISASLARSLLGKLLIRCGSPPVGVRLPDGTVVNPDRKDPVATIRIADYKTIVALLLDPEFQFGEAYADGRIEVEGDLLQCLTVLYRVMNQRRDPTLGKRLIGLLRRPASSQVSSARKNIHHHYDLGNEFYRLWLDEQMLYTCAYFSRPDLSLEQAQVEKMDHVCRKLRLRPGMEVVEAGCGWGALALHMATRYGVRVTAFNISREQVAWARQQATQSGLIDQVQFIEDDWRNIRGDYDAFVSVGMLEHVGLQNYQKLGWTIRRCLRPKGIGLIHSIGQNSPLPMNSWIERRIFPGAQLPSISQMMRIFEGPDFSVLDLENLRLHYAETLWHWLGRFEISSDEVRKRYGEKFVRLWRLYLAGSAAAFESGCMQLFQIVFANGIANGLPRNRKYQYDGNFDCRIHETDLFPGERALEFPKAEGGS